VSAPPWTGLLELGRHGQIVRPIFGVPFDRKRIALHA
jgi:hypothetical protein